MSKLTSIVVFLVGVSCTLLSSLILEHFSGGLIVGTKPGSFLPLEDELYLHTDDLSPNFLNPGTELAPKDPNHDQKTKNAEYEARNTLQAAAQMCQLGKLEKAGKLFEHALALSPRHPDVLTEYGEFLELSDVTRANHLYTRALIFAPGHRRALQNRQRTQPLVEQSDLELLRRIDRKLLELAKVPDSSSALRRVKKEAYFQQIHHTVGIEGNTMTLAETRMVVETRMAVGGRSVMEHNEILGLDAAIKYINTTLVHRIGDITLDDLLQIHRRVMGHADPLAAGQLRTTQVYVSEHVPPPPTRITPLLEGFIQWLNAPETVALHPVKYAALAHYKLVFIHPFSDGNGRTSRLLMNLILMQAGFPPVIIRKQDRHIYYRCLQLANEGDVRPFVRFIAECAEKTLDVYVGRPASTCTRSRRRRPNARRPHAAPTPKTRSCATSAATTWWGSARRSPTASRATRRGTSAKRRRTGLYIHRKMGASMSSV
ncbi:protein adenylyltransferase FICD-like [Pollicipes pollicipes]|uniref:protein adenylyltransferase FICD-like n=1 Tax=Pollicipes pollicipes TaxID=41117 RepID=UPI001884FE62|nr:protein adenylyltransferase FICD-like [Pollicipes pollicipes]